MPTWLVIVTSVASCLGTGGILVFVQFLIQRHDNKKGLLKQVLEAQNKLSDELNQERIERKEDMAKSEKDALRTQLLLMMSDYPHEHQEILLLAERYFNGVHGNWYCSTLFRKYLEKENIPLPHWYDPDSIGIGKE